MAHLGAKPSGFDMLLFLVTCNKLENVRPVLVDAPPAERRDAQQFFGRSGQVGTDREQHLVVQHHECGHLQFQRLLAAPLLQAVVQHGVLDLGGKRVFFFLSLGLGLFLLFLFLIEFPFVVLAL